MYLSSVKVRLYFRLADLLALDVELVFYDTTSVHFEVDEEDRAPQGEERVYGSRAAGAKPYRALIGWYLRSPQNRLQSELESSSLAVSFRMGPSRISRQIIHQIS